MTGEDEALIEAATAVIRARFRPAWHVIGAALRLRSGTIVTGVHIDAAVGRIAVCAEAIALGRAVTEYGSPDVETIVAVHHADNGLVSVVAPCGMCREIIADYAPSARILLPDPKTFVAPVPIGTLLPRKYKDPTQ